MEELGNVLRLAREKQGLSLSDIQQLTKIRTRYLEAIEQGDMSSLPGIVYAKGFIKSYAEQVGLDGQSLMEEHGLAVPEPEVPEERFVMPTPPVRRNPSHMSSQTKSYLIQASIVLVILCIVVAGFQFLIKRAPKSPMAPAASTELNTQGNAQTNAAAPVTNNVPPAQSGNAAGGLNSLGSSNMPNSTNSTNNPGTGQAAQQTQPLSPTTKTPGVNGTSSYSIPSDTPITVTFTATAGDCWIDVTSDQKEVEQLTLTSGQSKQYTASNHLQIVSGASDHLTVTVGNRPVDIEKVSGPYTFVFQHAQ